MFLRRHAGIADRHGEDQDGREAQDSAVLSPARRLNGTETEIARRYLGQDPVFMYMPRACLDRLVARMERLELAHGALLARAGRESDWVFLVVDGEVQRQGEDGEVLMTDGATPSGTLGSTHGVENWLQDRLEPATANLIVASESAVVFRAGAEDYTAAVGGEHWVKEAMKGIAEDQKRAASLRAEAHRDVKFIRDSEATFLRLLDVLENSSAQEVYYRVKDGIPGMSIPRHEHSTLQAAEAATARQQASLSGTTRDRGSDGGKQAHAEGN